MLKRILLATDFGPRSKPAEDHGIWLARLTGASCLLLHAVEALRGDDDEVQSIHAELERRAALLMAESVRRFTEQGLEVEARIAVGERWRTIVETARDANCDLIVMGSRPTLLDERASIGTTSHKVFFATSLPLLIVRQPEPAPGEKLGQPFHRRTDP